MQNNEPLNHSSIQQTAHSTPAVFQSHLMNLKIVLILFESPYIEIFSILKIRTMICGSLAGGMTEQRDLILVR